MDHRGTEMLVPDRSLVPSQQPFPVDAHPMVLDLSRIPAVVLIVEQRPVVTLRECVTIADPNCRPTDLPLRCHPEAAAR
jgi:hypothetical protein